ncbi:MAG: hypothetical protein Q7O66_14930 [Dehalococcoidia bacterium]|nr:hypothetical protein [Dehalococcoidia bacterium]
MNKDIRARLLAMPRQYEGASTSILDATHELSVSREKRDRREAALLAELVPVWQAEKSNETIRKAQTEAKLTADAVWLGLTTNIRLAEEQIKLDHSVMDCLRFERDCLGLIVNNEPNPF